MPQAVSPPGRFCSPKHLDKTYTSTKHRTVVCPAPALAPCSRLSPRCHWAITSDPLGFTGSCTHSTPKGMSRKGGLRLTKHFWSKELSAAAHLGGHSAAVRKQIFLSNPAMSQHGQESITHWGGSCLSLLLCSIQWFWSLSGLLTSASSPKQEIQQLSSPAQKLSF